MCNIRKWETLADGRLRPVLKEGETFRDVALRCVTGEDGAVCDELDGMAVEYCPFVPLECGDCDGVTEEMVKRFFEEGLE